jgi:hypothetical protein
LEPIRLTTPQPPSIFDLDPLEIGGTLSRVGLSFQDHVAAGFCIAMLGDSKLDQVWCETQDDITLIWKVNGNVTVEFVQVKSNELNQLWSIAMLCERDGKGPGHSILEKSLSNDRCKEPASFRIVTVRPVQTELAILRHSMDSAYRKKSEDGLKEVAALRIAVKKRVGDFTSPNSNDCTFWIDHSMWDERHSETSIKNESLRNLSRLIQETGTFLTEDQVEELYAQLVAKVAKAGRADHKRGASLKRLRRNDLSKWLWSTISDLLHPASVGTGDATERKMKAAGLAKDLIQSAQELRIAYRTEVLRPKYLNLKDRRLIEGEVLAALHQLRSKLDNEEIPDDGVDFHSRCLQTLENTRKSLRMTPKPPLMFLQGYMYNVVDRCMHRFRRVRG